MRLLVTGSTGYLGSELLRRASRLRGCEPLSPSGVSTRDGDLRDPDTAARLVGGYDAVVHTAYRQKPPAEAWSTNVEAARNVARAARGARLIHVSTDVVFSGRRGRPYVEEDELDPVTEYGRSKAAAEVAVRDEHPDALIVRTSLIYGGAEPSQHEQTAADPSFTFYEDELRNPIHIADLAGALLELVSIDVSGPLHVAGTDAVSRCEFARLLTRKDVRCGPAPPGRPLDCRLDSSRAQSLLTTRLRGVHEVLA